MRKIKMFIGFAVLIASFLLISSNSYAAEVKYTENVIPKMTGDTQPSGVVSASLGSYNQWNAFDRVISTVDRNTNQTAWVSPNNNEGWLAYRFYEKNVLLNIQLQ